MTSAQQIEREVTTIVLAAVADEATDEQLTRLNHLLETNPALADLVVELMSQEAWLNWCTARSRSGGVRGELLDHIAHVVESSASGDGASDSCETASRVLNCSPHLATPMPARWAGYYPAVAAVLLVALGGVLGFAVARWDDSAPTRLAGRTDSGSAADADVANYVARFVHGTACLWDQDTNISLRSDDNLRMGESLSLVEGLAEVQLEWKSGGAALRIEGPAGLVLTAERGASLSHGRFTADVEASDGSFSLSTPNGVIEVGGDASLGVAIHGSSVELHMFKGTAKFNGAWSRGRRGLRPVDVVAGDAIRISADDDGRIRLDRDMALPSSFASKLSMGADDLHISSQYVQEIKAAEPTIYWRFEDADPSQVANEVNDNYQAQLFGVADRVKQAGNTSLELGAGLTDQALSSYIYCDQPLEQEFSEGYTLEAWVKPSHYHWGSLVGFLGQPEQPGWRPPHGLLLEIGGPRTSASEIEHPGRIRYLHRNPPGGDFESGTSCFSRDAYELRKWQHVVAVKSGAKMRLFINGESVAEGHDPSILAPGMRVIIGQLDREQFYRKFIGQIDELAIYPRPLSEKEIKQHFRLIRPTWKRMTIPVESGQTALQPVASTPSRG